MPDDRNVPVGGAGQTHSARVKFASDTVREKVGDLLAEAGGTLAAVNEDERRRVARRLRKAKGAAALNLLPLLTLLLAACGKAAPDIAGQQPDAEGGAEEDGAGSSGEGLSARAPSGEGSAGDDPSAADVSGGWRFVKASTRAGKPPMSPEAEANMVRLCLQAITDNSLQASAIHEICSLIDLDAVDRSHDVIWRWNAPPRTEGYSTNKVCYLVNAQDLLFWMFMESPAPATGYAGRVRPKNEPEIPGDAQGDGITDASLVTVVAAVPEAAAAAGGGFGGGLAALPLLALGGGGGGGGGGAAGAAAALAAPPVIPAASEQVPEQDGQVAAPAEQVPVEEPAQDRPDPQPDAPPPPQQPLFRAAPPPPPPPREEAPPESVVPPEQPAPVAPPPDPFAPGSAPAGGQPIRFFVTDDPVENARIYRDTHTGVNGSDFDGDDNTFGNADDRLAGSGRATEAGHNVAGTTASGTITFTDDDAEHDAAGADKSADFDFLIASGSTATGANDADGNPTVTRKTVFVDGDFTANPSGGSAVAGRYGSLVVDEATGRWTYTVDNSDNDVKGLDDGETMFEEFAVRIRDARGGVSQTEYIRVTITAPAPALVLDGNSAGAGNTTSEDLRGDNTANTFIIDDDPSVQASADTIAGFEAQDSIRLGDDDGTGTATVTFEYDGTDTLLYNTDTTGDDAAAKAGKVLAVLTGYDLSADGNALQATDVIGAGTVINLHGGGTAAGSQAMQGAATTKDVFNVDGTAGDRASADIIKAFEDGTDIVKVAGDIDIFWHVETVNAGQPDEAKNTILRTTNSDSEDNIIAIIEGFDADAAGVTFDDSDFVGNGTIQEIT